MIDIWRGFALFGVVVVNFASRNSEFLSDANARLMPTFDLDWKINLLTATFLGNKSHTIFTFLFGLGFAIIIERASRAEANPDRVLIRRMLVLLTIGWLHFLLLFSGEEIHVYAVCGLVLITCRRLSNATLLSVGVFLAIIPRLVLEEWPFFASLLGLHLPDHGPSGQATLADPDTALEYLRQDRSYLVLNGTLACEQLRNWPTSGAYFLYFLGRILLGFVCWRAGWVRRLIGADGRTLLQMSVVLGSVSVVLVCASMIDWAGPKGTLSHCVYNLARQTNFLVMASFYLVTLTLLCKHARAEAALSPLASLGRMSLTNYMMQSVFIMVILAGPGFGLAGQIGSAALLAIAVFVYALQVLISIWWTHRFRHGPVEWVWRYLTYG